MLDRVLLAYKVWKLVGNVGGAAFLDFSACSDGDSTAEVFADRSSSSSESEYDTSGISVSVHEK